MKFTGKHAAIGGAALAAVMAIAVPFVGSHEGLVKHVYPDPVSHGAPWTYCYGETKDPQFGHTYTTAECDAKLALRLPEFAAGVEGCIGIALPTKAEAAFISTAYNIGVPGFCRSSIVTKANAGDLTGACNRLPVFNRAGGKVVPGLTVRRGDEQKLCLEGVREGVPN